MKVVILAGGLGTRLSEETENMPKPMIEIGGKPIIWHIMKSYSSYGFNDFVILLGYKGYVIKEYFYNYFIHQSDITVDLSDNNIEIHQNNSENWKVTLVDTGVNTMTGGRVKRAKKYLNNETFMLTYGDGVSDVNIQELMKFHQSQDKKITMTAVQIDGRFGALNIGENHIIDDFVEKPKGDGAWINGGYFICEPEVLDVIDDDTSIFEQAPLKRLAEEKQLVAYKHPGFWKCMDTLRDKFALSDLCESNEAPWKNNWPK